MGRSLSLGCNPPTPASRLDRIQLLRPKLEAARRGEPSLVEVTRLMREAADLEGQAREIKGGFDLVAYELKTGQPF